MNNINCSNFLMYALLAVIMVMLVNKCMNEGFANIETTEEIREINEPIVDKTETEEDVSKTEGVQPYSGDSNELNLKSNEDTSFPLGKCGTGQFMSSNLLPKSDPNLSDDFAEFAPKLEGKNFVDAYKFVFGNQSQTLRNANYQLRSDPENPQEAVCPWMQSTIYPEKRRQLSIGS